jgi:PAS domain S-box-containing protein
MKKGKGKKNKSSELGKQPEDAATGPKETIETERKKVEEALRKSEANYRTIFNAANDAIFVHDIENGKIIGTNQKAFEMFGYTQEEFKNLSIEDISTGAPPFTQQEAMNRIKKAIGEGPQLFEWICKNKTGHTFWVEVNLKLAVIEGQERMLAIVRDITERKDIESRQLLTSKILELINQKREKKEIVRDVVAMIKEATGFAAVGIRLQEGDDFPYFEVNDR